MTGDSAAKTTVVVPVWDGYVGERLTEALASVRQQDLAAPILLVDNASEVELPDVPGVVVVRAARRLTLGDARNLGLSHVATPYVVLWDADDVMLPGTLSFLQNAIESNPSLAAFGAAIVEESGARHRWPRRWIGSVAQLPAVFSLLHCVWSLLPTTGSTIMRADLIRAGGGYSNADSGDDWVAGVSLAFRGRIGWSERPGRVYRIHDQSIWARHMSVTHQIRHARTVRDRIRVDAGIPGWARAVLPLIQLGQNAAIAAHAAVAAARRSGLSRRGTRR